MSSFKFPPFYSFPPSFTKQPVPVTLAKQTSLWCDLIRDYCRFHRIFWIDVTEAASSPLFHNSAIQRKLSFENIEYFLGELVNRGEAEWDEGKNRCLVFWRKPDEWGDMIYQWIDETGRNGTILTLYEIRLSDETRGRDFYGLDIHLTLKALNALEVTGKAAVFQGDVTDQLGVKFL